MSELEAAAAGWARERPDVHALLLVGSRARAEQRADAWSDHDFVVVADDDELFLRDGAWVAELGPVLLSFVEDAAAGAVRERRVLFADGADADFSVIPLARLQEVLARPDVAGVLARGVRVLVDKGVLGELPGPSGDVGAGEPRENLVELAHEFWYRAILTARKLRRGEVHVAVQSCNCALRTLLRRALALEAHAAGRDPWHDGRFLERWADPGRRKRLAGTIAPEDPAGAAGALLAACELFADVSAALARAQGLALGIDLPAVRARLDAVLGGYGRAERLTGKSKYVSG